MARKRRRMKGSLETNTTFTQQARELVHARALPDLLDAQTHALPATDNKKEEEKGKEKEKRKEKGKEKEKRKEKENE